MRNIKKLRKMSTEEFAIWLNDISQACFGCDGCPHCAYDKNCNEISNITNEMCQTGILLWLKQEAKK